MHEKSVNDVFTRQTMKRLLVLVREVNNSSVKQNCAILIGKLVKANTTSGKPPPPCSIGIGFVVIIETYDFSGIWRR